MSAVKFSLLQVFSIFLSHFPPPIPLLCQPLSPCNVRIYIISFILVQCLSFEYYFCLQIYQLPHQVLKSENHARDSFIYIKVSQLSTTDVWTGYFFVLRGCSVHCRTSGSIFVAFTQQIPVASFLPDPPNGNTEKYLQTLLNVTCRQSTPG